jgi:hypothetical protein
MFIFKGIYLCVYFSVYFYVFISFNSILIEQHREDILNVLFHAAFLSQ